jgi:hypothetical protein
MTTGHASVPTDRHAGWILVTGLLALCVTGTWFTAWNYRRQVFSSAQGVVLANQWPESRIAVRFSAGEASHLRVGQIAKITTDGEKALLTGSVLSVAPSKDTKENATVIISLATESGHEGHGFTPEGERGSQLHLPAGAPCSVTIDTTVPLSSEEATPPAASPSPSAR